MPSRSRSFHYPLSCRLPVPHRARVVRIAAMRGLSISALIKEALKPYIFGTEADVDADVDKLSVFESVPVRPQIDPRNRIRDDAPLDRAGRFSEKMR
jgi:hypothetical protein